MNNNTIRNHNIDAAKAIGIFLVCLGHICTTKSPNSIVNFINCFCYTFHIPLFFFISGMLFKKEQAKFSDFIKRKFKALIIPYFLYGIISVIIYMVTNKAFSVKAFFENILILFYESGIIKFNIALWFLPCLFLSCIIMFFIIKYIKNVNITCAVLLIICILLDYFIKIPLLPFNIHSLPYSVFFMLLGYCSKELLNIIPKLKPIYNILLSALFYIITLIVTYFNQRSSLNTNTYNNIWLYFIGAISGIFATLILSDLLSKFKPICKLGENSLGIMVIHSPLLMIILKIISKLSNILKINDFSLNSNAFIAVSASIILTLISYLIYSLTKKFAARTKNQ